MYVPVLYYFTIVLSVRPLRLGKTIARKKMQDRYISQIFELYEDFHVILMPLLDNEVRGVPSLESFSKLLINPSS